VCDHRETCVWSMDEEYAKWEAGAQSTTYAYTTVDLQSVGLQQLSKLSVCV